MKTSILTALLIGSLFTSTMSEAHTIKKLKVIDKTAIEFNLSNFCQYLENGNPNKLEGIYKSPNGKYVFALVKNNTTEHDFIGLVLATENKKWKVGEVKFNFVLNKDTLEGYYYNEKGKHIPVKFAVNNDTIKTNVLTKIALSKIKAGTLACFRKN